VDASSAAWTPIELPPDPSSLPGSNINGLHLGLDGRLVVAISGHFLTVGADGAAAALQSPTDGGTTFFTMRGGPGADAFFWARPDAYVARRDGSWASVQLLDAAADPTPAVDTLGRLWLVPRAGGFGVRDVDGRMTTWQSCSTLGDVLDLAVAGRGPALPTALPAPVRGSVRGRLTRKHKPAAGLTVAIASPRALLGKPESAGCEVHASGPALPFLPGAAAARTDGEGRFVIADVPRVALGLVAFEADGKPIVSGELMNLACCQQMKDASGVDVGTIDLP
jgi:hypothetical protein